VNYTWSFYYESKQVVLFGPIVEFIFDEAGDYIITLMISDLSGLTSTGDLAITVGDTTPPYADAGDDRTVDQHTLVLFNSTDSYDNIGITNITWRFHYGGQDCSLYGPLPTFLFDEVGVYTIGLFVTDASGHQGYDSIVLNVRDVTPPVARAGDDQTVEMNIVTEFNGSGSSDNVAIVNWSWTIDYQGDNVRLFGDHPLFTFEYPGTYQVFVIVTDAVGLQNSDSMVVVVKDNIHPIAVISINPIVDVGIPIIIYGNLSSDNIGIEEWLWTIEIDGNAQQFFGSEIIFIFPVEGNYNISLQVTDIEGLMDIEVTSVKAIDDGQKPVVPNGEDGIESWLYLVMGIAIALISIYFLIRWRRVVDNKD
ncbi:MAG: hypothetical protein GWN76_10800, partial [candidate division Zixibacteria bacterium]|nr:hypothetical protein [candidate division Zixibacteria bacterium]NIR64810.1 hypothetical protein [candidate division Zixibacteria bacterium]NIS47988.1 hypothetical protein [candidate division Zixibacteria bacterium]NIU14474.1 hypothetical protein [candidate division Zixibacteria bacterium]NIX58456.1 hypothetical protein [candidate division Zixibacteria bacterium]